MLQYDEPRQDCEDLSEEAGMEEVVRKTPTCGRNGDCGWGPVRVVFLVGALVVPAIALTASWNWAVRWHCQDWGLRQNERIETGI